MLNGNPRLQPSLWGSELELPAAHLSAPGCQAGGSAGRSFVLERALAPSDPLRVHNANVLRSLVERARVRESGLLGLSPAQSQRVRAVGPGATRVTLGAPAWVF